MTWTDIQGSPGLTSALAYGNGVFVVAKDGIKTSPDGVQWTRQDYQGWNPVGALAYGTGTFVLAGCISNEATGVDRAVIIQSAPFGKASK